MGGTTEDSTTVEELDVREERQSCFAHRVLRRRCRGLRVRQVVEVADHRQPGQDDCSSSTE